MLVIQVVAVAPDHIGQYERIAVQIHLEGSRDDGGETVVQAPDGVAVYHANEDGEVLGPGGKEIGSDAELIAALGYGT